MSFAKEHLIGIVLGVVLYELYYRSTASKPGGAGP